MNHNHTSATVEREYRTDALDFVAKKLCMFIITNIFVVKVTCNILKILHVIAVIKWEKPNALNWVYENLKKWGFILKSM